MKRQIALLLALVMLLCGCTGREAPVETTSAPEVPTTVPVQTVPPTETESVNMQIVELTAWVTAEDIWADPETLDAMLAEFNAYYPNILVHVEHVSPDRLAEEKPNIILGNTGDLALWAAEGGMADLSRLWENLDAYSNVQTACGDENGYFAIPMCVVPCCMAINREKFEAAQAMSLINTANHTWSTPNFLKAGENLYHSGLENALTLYCMDTEGDVYTRLLVENMYGGSYVNTINGTYTADSSAMANGVRALREGLGFKYLSEVSASMALEQFLNGETAMTLNWSSALQLKHMENEDIFYMLYPAGGKTKTYADVYGLGVFVSEDVQKQAASMTFAAYAASSDAVVRATGQLPACQSGEDAYVGTEQEEVMKDLMKLLGYMVEGEIPGKCWEGARQEWVDMLQEISRGTNVVYCTEVCQVELEALLRSAENE